MEAVTLEDAIVKMRELADETEEGDYEKPHAEADELIIDVLRAEGGLWERLADEFSRVGKWYA